MKSRRNSLPAVLLLLWTLFCLGALLVSRSFPVQGHDRSRAGESAVPGKDVREALTLREGGNFREAARAFEQCLNDGAHSSSWPAEVRDGEGVLPLIHWAATCYLESDSPPGDYYPGKALSHFEHAFDTLFLFPDAGTFRLTQKRRYDLTVRSAQGLIRLLRAAGRDEEAFRINEKLRNSTVTILWGDQADLLYKCGGDFMRAQGHVSLLKKRRDEMLLSPALHEENEYGKLNFQVQEGLSSVRNIHAERRGSFSTLLRTAAPLTQVLQERLGDDTALLAYYHEKAHPLRSPGLMLRVVTGQAARDYGISLKGSDLERLVTVLNQRVLTHSHLWNEQGTELYRKCISPARQLLEGKKKLVIVPDGIMHSLPFCLLLDPRGRSLGETFEITYAPSASTWAPMKPFSFSGRTLAVEDRRSNPGDVPGKGIPLPCFTGHGCAGLKLSIPPGTLCRIPAPCLVHHRMPSLSGLYGKSGTLTRDDFFSLPIENACIMADACTTSLDSLYDGNEISAFSGPFFQAGASAVLFTLWPPPAAAKDEAYALFTRELSSSGSPAKALQAMQTAMRKKYPLPVNWAPYVLYGR